MKTKIFSASYAKDLEKLVNEWLDINPDVIVHSQTLTFNSDLNNHVLSLLYHENKPMTLNS